ncbi:DNA/RNA nuclease SfsA [Venenivibrio stagnispumantis]|uniref:Sugar fermentation stimulation protein A n=1 Tax=Venenivibrio stagnispumantis TaxID=407998 RepID=A0AA45WIS0_9AQUI|nr:DNA/RNA nuclease SfsA [Venenivibrio stagnispumantis]MCW4572665.1 DNA/RNA nuclease SfsA [Venenivibrio stagnispumantis]SMP01016.1 sugar fermentation stimulation protein A [Venenivibrio stagnispumantis]
MILFDLKSLGKIEEAVFLERPNRFKAICKKGNEIITCHVADSGRLKEIFIKGRQVFVIKNNPDMKTDYKIIAINVDGEIVLLNTSLYSKIGEEAIKKGVLGFIPDKIKKEVQFGNSRIDYLINENILVELKGSNLLIENKCLFPDAPTERGARHLEELIEAKKQGYKAIILFMAVRKCNCFYPYKQVDEKFFNTFFKALQNGVEFKGFKIEIDKNFNVILKENIKICE